MRQKAMTYDEAMEKAVERLRRWHSHYIPGYQFHSIAITVLGAIGFTERTQVVQQSEKDAE